MSIAPPPPILDFFGQELKYKVFPSAPPLIVVKGLTTGGSDRILTTGGSDRILTTSGTDRTLTTGGSDRILTTNGSDRILTTGGSYRTLTTSGSYLTFGRRPHGRMAAKRRIYSGCSTFPGVPNIVVVVIRARCSA